jgi:hypothetical protein
MICHECGTAYVNTFPDTGTDCPTCQPPAVVAECLTCRAAYDARGLVSDNARRSYRAHPDRCRSLGHDVREVTR